MISFYKGMIDIWDKALPDDLMPLFSMERLSRGLYMLDKEKTGDIDFKHSTETAENIFKWMDIQKMKESSRFTGLTRKDIVYFIRMGISGEERFRNVFLKWILKPSFYSLMLPSNEDGLSRLLGKNKITRDSAQCPVCNSPPGMSIVETSNDQKRFLSCCFCCYRWEFKIGVCPGCGNSNSDNFGFIVGESDYDQAARAVSCENCKSYLKTIFIKCRKDGKQALELDMDIEDVVTLSLDIMANQRGYRSLCEK